MAGPESDPPQPLAGDLPRAAPTMTEKLQSSHASRDKGMAPIADLGKPIDPMGLAQALFQTGDYEGALTTYHLLDIKNLSKTDRAAVQYFMATCLRRLGKLDEAAALYRDVVNAKEDEILADCAQWQLSAFRWRRDLETQLEQMRQRRHSVGVAP
jgi:tetratricopeptide (TPR) repeat protein